MPRTSNRCFPIRNHVNGSATIDNLIVGSGLAGIATAMALHESGKRFTVLDVGFDLEKETDQEVARLAQQEPQSWRRKVDQRLFPPTDASTNGIGRRAVFGSDFPYRIPKPFKVKTEDCETEFSHGLGGFGNVWGAAMLPYSSHTLRGWPIPKEDIDRSYRNVLKYVPLSAEKDGLEHSFPLHTDRVSSLDRSHQVDALLQALDVRKEALAARGVEFGRARVAVNSNGSDSSCKYCGLCLEGCVYGSIFNPRLLWKRLEASNSIHRGVYVLEFKEHDDHVLVTTVGATDGVIRQWRAKRVFLAAGHFATTRIIARSLGRLNERIRITDSQYFFFPFLSYRTIQEETRFSLADVFMEVLNKDICDSRLHFQVYGMRSVFQQALRALLPRPLPLSFITGRFFLFQGYLPPSESGHLELEVVRAGETKDQVVVRGVHNPRASLVARKAQAFLRKNLLSFGVTPPFSLRLVPPGRSFHAGGSFPMGGPHSTYSSDSLGRPAGLRRVHIMDSASFPSIASSTIGYTIMANADRIARAWATTTGA